MTRTDEINEQDEIDKANDGLKSTNAFSEAITVTLSEVIHAAVRDRSADPEYPDTPPETWQMLFLLLGSDRVLKALSQELRSRMLASEP